MVAKEGRGERCVSAGEKCVEMVLSVGVYVSSVLRSCTLRTSIWGGGVKEVVSQRSACMFMYVCVWMGLGLGGCQGRVSCLGVCTCVWVYRGKERAEEACVEMCKCAVEVDIGKVCVCVCTRVNVCALVSEEKVLTWCLHA